MTPFAIAGMQLNLSAEHDNIAYMRSRLGLLMHIYPWVQMVVFSELAAFGPSPRRAQRLPGPAEDEFREMARQHDIWLLPGTLFEKKDDKVFNTASVINPQGEIVGRFRKLFPFRPYELEVEAGDEFLVFDVPEVGRFGVSICYDMWFPETSRTLAAMGAEIILHPTMTPTIDRDVELAIARATAAQQQCFFFDINGAGGGGNGRSIIVGPYGDVLYQAGHSEEMIPIEIDVDRVRRSRETGLRGLGQPLKSFRDRNVQFSIYERGQTDSNFFHSLGPLEKPTRGSRAGLAKRSKEET
ncbi:MAG: carbon-nitrogen hydrolase family protein [Bryobacterales bacterium]|nr:carbon-nitrogen hydrolase family protein [Acidobacteriota bacterium]MCB9385534.1 carbon-nitrogen hydrolase family protein [Bryobacterales bacterium]